MAGLDYKNLNALSERIEADDLLARHWSVEESFEYCERLARAHYENFPVGSALVPKRLRKHFYSIYAFARTADDFADEGADLSADRRLAQLSAWREQLHMAFEGEAAHPVFVALQQTQSNFNLPIALFDDLLSAFSQDVLVRRYESFDQLLDYCRRSANPIGRLILLLFGYNDTALHEQSDEICTALQLANHWQDVAVDLQKERVYLPAEDLEHFGVTIEELKAGLPGEDFRKLMKYEIDRAREFFLRGKPLCGAVGGRLGLELRAVWLGGWRILDRIEGNGYDVFTRRPTITFSDKLRIFLGAFRKGAFIVGR
ncbi:MAG TPA: squalene synthase HpnC [Blastocatellia bacterium]|nr:squalene synthase HpnC [Blastocatellia bacterium]